VLHDDEVHVVTAVRDGGRMKGSDAEVWNDLFHVWTFRDRRVLRISSHTDKNRALEAAGLRE
jgi:ketosteroid isomerase-like protein